MSQTEVMICLVKLGGSATIHQLAEEYNKIHFPRNNNYQFLSINEVKKTMQSDSSKLMRDRIISRKITKPIKYNIYDGGGPSNRRIVTYSLTDYGWKIINGYKLQQIQPLQ